MRKLVKTIYVISLILSGLGFLQLQAANRDIPQVSFKMFKKSSKIALELKDVDWKYLSKLLPKNSFSPISWEKVIKSIPKDISAESQRILKNLPFAVHGYRFTTKDLYKFYSQFPWYKINPKMIPSIKLLTGDGRKFFFMITYKLYGKPERATDSVDIELIGKYESGGIEDFFVDRHWIYIRKPDKFLVIDVSNPSNPQEISSMGILTNAVSAVGKHAVFFEEMGLNIIDVSKPQNLKEVGFYKKDYRKQILNSSKHRTIRFFDKLIYAPFHNRVDIIDISRPYSPRYVNNYCLSTRVPVVVSGDKLLEYDIFKIHVINDKYALIDANGLAGYANDIGYNNFIREIIDISNPSKPFYVCTWRYFEGDSKFLHSNNNFMFLENNIFEISNIRFPVRIGTIPFKIAYIKNNFAFSYHNNEIKFLDITNPYLPIELCNFSIPINEKIKAISAQGKYLYILTSKCLMIYEMAEF